MSSNKSPWNEIVNNVRNLLNYYNDNIFEYNSVASIRNLSNGQIDVESDIITYIMSHISHSLNDDKLWKFVKEWIKQSDTNPDICGSFSIVLLSKYKRESHIDEMKYKFYLETMIWAYYAKSAFEVDDINVSRRIQSAEMFFYLKLIDNVKSILISLMQDIDELNDEKYEYILTSISGHIEFFDKISYQEYLREIALGFCEIAGGRS